MIPKAIRRHFNITRQTKGTDDIITEGTLSCCDGNDFEISVIGEIKRGFFSKMELLPSIKTALEARCKRCGKIISVFDSSLDGYGPQAQCVINEEKIGALPSAIDCVKCRSNSFSVSIKYEYSGLRELQELGLTDVDNAFTWIWITLVCNKCGANYKNFIDFETD